MSPAAPAADARCGAQARRRCPTTTVIRLEALQREPGARARRVAIHSAIERRQAGAAPDLAQVPLGPPIEVSAPPTGHRRHHRYLSVHRSVEARASSGPRRGAERRPWQRLQRKRGRHHRRPISLAAGRPRCSVDLIYVDGRTADDSAVRTMRHDVSQTLSLLDRS